MISLKYLMSKTWGYKDIGIIKPKFVAKIQFHPTYTNTVLWTQRKTLLNFLRTRAAGVHLNFRAGSTFPVPVCTLPPGRGQNSWSSSVYKTSWCNKVDAVRLYTSIGWIYFYYSDRSACRALIKMEHNHLSHSHTPISSSQQKSVPYPNRKG